MQRKYYLMTVLLVATTVLISGCGKKTANQPAAVNNQIDNQQNANQDQANGTVSPSGQYSINELFAMNKPIKCTWKESATGKSDVTNIIYLNDKKFYQDVTMGDIGHSFTIFDKEYLYIWNDFNDVASKMKETNATTGNQPNKNSAGMEQKKDFICENWVADNSFFIPPQNKNFKDVTEEMTQAVQEMNGEGAKNTTQMICDACKNAPTPELKAKCLGDTKCD
jgi:hypothetical protein